jgi:RNA recognition motif-containing protein
VGNLPTNTTEDGLMRAFAAWGPASVTLPAQSAGRQSAFGFIEIPDDEQAAKAIEEMNGKELDGRELTVNEARPRPQREGGVNRGRIGW